MHNNSLGQRLLSGACYSDIRQYNDLKESDEKERAASRQLYEHLRQQRYTDDGARKALAAKGYNPGLV